MYPEHNGVVLEILEKSGRCSPSELEALRETQERTGEAMATLAVQQGWYTRESLLEAVADFLGLALRPELPQTVPPEVLRLVSAQRARSYGVVPLQREGKRLTVVALDPFNPQVVDDLTFALDMDIESVVADPDAVQQLLQSVYGVEQASLEEVLSDLGGGPELGEDAEKAELESVAGDAPVVRLVDVVLRQAIRERASDIHFEPFEDALRIRYRVDGALFAMTPTPRRLAGPVTARIKVLADLNIAERRVPQDGRIKLSVDGRAVDLRVSTLPTQFGESVVLRVLDKSVVNLDLEGLGMPVDILDRVRELAKRPNGIFIVTGPTGSGKTTTLYSALREVNTEDTKILTAEDPVEYEIDGIMQVAMHPGIGLNFATTLRSFLRQDPDKILVGEIRDLETARIAVQASLTGHLVLSTLHTNDAAGAVTRLVDMGVEPYLIAASLEAVLAQRLVRRICSNCRQWYVPDEDTLHRLQITRERIGDRKFAYGKGCEQCHGSGYKGRHGLFEMILMSDRLREAISRRASTLELRRLAFEEGTLGLREDGLRGLLDGVTTVDEVLRYT
ncbi:MAG: type II/IV secretion system protein [Opitutales bacterium]|nr:type II/IV secretion system protein [Opitutales bacterium]